MQLGFLLRLAIVAKDVDLAKMIVASMAEGFKGDARRAALAFQRLYQVLRKYGDEEAKTAAADIVAAMGRDFRGDIGAACDAFERLVVAIVLAKSGKPITRRLDSLGE